MKLTRSILVAAVAFFVVAPTLAEPPPWAPAHGWRKKNDPNYVGYTGKKWDRDYGVIEGRCNSAAVGAVLGGATGAAIGSQVSEPQDRAVAMVLGTAIGAIIGAKIGEEIDESDRGWSGRMPREA